MRFVKSTDFTAQVNRHVQAIPSAQGVALLPQLDILLFQTELLLL
jgi:hypothetical protein